MRFQIERHIGSLRSARALVEAPAADEMLEAAAAPPALPLPEFNPLDYVSYLLYIDAEIEHGLMVMYLYGAYSLGGPQVPEQHRETVRSWQEIILGIAKEEMGHLISVQNVLRLIGAPLNLGRDDYPWDTPFYPFPFMLEPLTLDSLAKYVYAESPEDWSGPWADEIKKRVEKATPNPVRVGELFTMLIGLVKDPNFLPDEVFQAGTWPFQAKWDEWGRGYKGGARGDSTKAHPKGTPDVLVEPVASRDDAVNALTEIAEQGEAPPSDSPEAPSHFTRFLNIYKEMSRLCLRGWDPARNVAVNPYLPPSSGDDPSQDESSDQERDPITHPEAAVWGHLFNVRYRLSLNFLLHSFQLQGGLNVAGAWTPRGTIINAAFGEMYNLRAIANFLVKTPLSNHPEDGKTAGPPFQMPYTLNLPTGEANRWRAHRNLLFASEPLIAELLKISPPSRHRYLYALREADQGLLEVIDPILAAHTKLALT